MWVGREALLLEKKEKSFHEKTFNSIRLELYLHMGLGMCLSPKHK
jgi:hypothetical protein